jgi:hypothetical protein
MQPVSRRICTAPLHPRSHSYNTVTLTTLLAGKPSAEQLAHIRTRKAAPPVIEVTLADGSKVPLWNTFKDQQVRQMLLRCCHGAVTVLAGEQLAGCQVTGEQLLGQAACWPGHCKCILHFGCASHQVYCFGHMDI